MFTPILKRLEINRFRILDINFGETTRLSRDPVPELLISAKELEKVVKEVSPKVKTVKISLAKPGDRTRIICVKDGIEPRAYLTPQKIVTIPRAAVITCGKIVAFQEGIVDMTGPGAFYTPFSRTLNVILEIEVKKSTAPHEHEKILRLAGLKASRYLAYAVANEVPDKTEICEWEPLKNSGLPKVTYIYMLLAQGLLHDTYVFGCDAKDKNFLPIIVSPLDILNDAVNSGNCVSACDKNTTWHHQNNPVVKKLLELHGKKINFVGVILTNEMTRLEQKKDSAGKTAKLAKQIGAEAAIISKEGFGNPDADLMMIIRGLYEAGIQDTICLTDEYAGSEGMSQSLADTTPEANVIISTGNANEIIVLPPMETIIGPVKDLTQLAGAYPHSVRADGSLEVELQAIIGATNEIGHSKLSCREV